MSDVMKHDETTLIALDDASVAEVSGGMILQPSWGINPGLPFSRWPRLWV
ncbi:MAG: hypothetical protein ACK5JR_06845 [Tropicimonas sp.]